MADDDPRIFVLHRELSEVHLLLDNISSNPGLHLPVTSDTVPGLPDNWLRGVCQIEWPPEDVARDPAAEAELLIKVKDYLNTLAKPASGKTIAFTLMVNQDDEADPVSRADGPSRQMLACTAYPDLLQRANGFRRAMWWMRMFLLGWLVLTCVTSWYVAFGNAALAQRSAAAASLDQAEQRIGSPNPRGDGAMPRGSQEAALHCPVSRGVGEPRPYASDTQRQACAPLRRATDAIRYADDEINRWLFRRWGGGSEAVSAYAAVLAAILGTAVLPVLYGILGAGAAVIRVISGRISANLLEPRDLNLSLQQLALGAVMGACISLFVGVPANGQSATVLGPVALSASALSFIAGFGVDAVFATLEGVIARIFNLQTATPPPASATATAKR